MNLWIEIVKPHLVRILLFSSLTLWAGFATFVAISKKSEVLLIGIDKNGSRVIRAQDDPLFKTELVAFLSHYFSLAYDFTPKTFKKRVGDATALMSDSLWQTESSKIKRLKDLVEKSGLTQKSKLQQLNKIDPESFQALVAVEQNTRLKSQRFQMKVSVTIKKVARTHDNPWGMEVSKIKEERL